MTPRRTRRRERHRLRPIRTSPDQAAIHADRKSRHTAVAAVTGPPPHGRAALQDDSRQAAPRGRRHGPTRHPCRRPVRRTAQLPPHPVPAPLTDRRGSPRRCSTPGDQLGPITLRATQLEAFPADTLDVVIRVNQSRPALREELYQNRRRSPQGNLTVRQLSNTGHEVPVDARHMVAADQVDGPSV